MYELMRPWLFALDAERSHVLGMSALAALGALPGPLQPAPGRSQTVMGIEFPNVVGVAAGLDKDALAVEGLARLGFGHIEVGTVTPQPQPGNPKPRLFRLPEASALINRMGFNNDGARTVAVRLKRLRGRGSRLAAPLGVNIGKNKDTPIERAVDDYLACMDALHDSADYLTVNLSSPNTPGLRDLQFGEPLRALLGALKARQAQLQSRSGRQLPLCIKLAPGLGRRRRRGRRRRAARIRNRRRHRGQHHHAALLLDVPKRGPLLVEEVGRHLHRERRDDPSGVLLHRLAGEQPEHRHRERFGVANVAAAVAARTDLVAGLAEGGPQPLPRHLEQPEARDLSELNPGPIHLQGIAQALLHLTLVADRGHVDEVDHDESADVADPELSGDLVGCLQVGLERGLLDVRAAGGPCGVDVDGHQRFGMVDDDGAAGRKAHAVVEGSFDSALDLVPAEQRHPVLVELQAVHAARHDQAHELARLLVHLRGIDENLLGVLAEVVPQGADDDVALLIDEEGAGRSLAARRTASHTWRR